MTQRGAKTGRSGFRVRREDAAGLFINDEYVEGDEVVPGESLVGLSVHKGDTNVVLTVTEDTPGAPLNQMVGNHHLADRPNHNELKAKDVRHFAFRTTMQLRAIAQSMGINPVEILLWQSAGLSPKFVARRDPQTGRLRLYPKIDAATGEQLFEEMDSTAQLIAAKEASKYLYPQLKAVDLGKDLTDNTVADEKVNQAFSTFANLARQVLGTGENAKVVVVEEAPGDDSGEEA